MSQFPSVKSFLPRMFKHWRRLSKNIGAKSDVPIPRVEKKSFYPVSSTQKRMYMVQKLSEQGSGTGYNLPVAIRLTGELKVEHLEDVLQRLVDRHEALRTSFTMSDGELVQVVHDHPDWSMTRLDWRGRESVELSELIQPFDLERAPLFRATLIQRRRKCTHVDVGHAPCDFRWYIHSNSVG